MKLIIALLALLLPFGVLGSENYGSVIVYRVISVYDGDTMRVDIDGWPDIVGKNIGVRLYGIDTPEMRDKRFFIKKKAKKARDYLRKRLAEADVIEIADVSRGKYFRVVGKVLVDGDDVGKEMIELGLAKPYYGGKKLEWN